MDRGLAGAWKVVYTIINTACYGKQKYPRKVLSWYFRRKLSHVRSVWEQKVPSKVWKLLLLQKIARFGEKVWKLLTPRK